MLRLFSNYDNYSDYEKKKLMHKLVKNIEIYPEKKAYGYLKSIEFAFPVFKSDLTEDKDTIYTIQDAYPGLIDENGEFTDYDPDEGYARHPRGLQPERHAQVEQAFGHQGHLLLPQHPDERQALGLLEDRSSRWLHRHRRGRIIK